MQRPQQDDPKILVDASTKYYKDPLDELGTYGIIKIKKKGGMSFRDLVFFKKALLTKQTWRLVEDPSSLVACILKAKYYPRGSVMKASLGRKPSFAWRRMSSARTVLQNG
jgi:hypothetical protein